MIFLFLQLKVRSLLFYFGLFIFCYFAVPESWGHQLFYVEQPPSPENPFRLELNIVNGLNSSTSALPLRAIMEDETLDSGFETETAPVRAETSNAINNPEHDHDADEDQEQEREIATEEAKEDPGVIARFTGGAFRQTSKLTSDGFDAFSTKKHTFLEVCTIRAAVLGERGEKGDYR